MPRNTAVSMYGGAGGRGCRASVTSLDRLRNVLRNETENDSAPGSAAAPAPPAAPPCPAAPAAPGDDKQTLRALNNRLNGYLGRVKQLQEENDGLKNQIDDILAKRKAPQGRDWDEVQKPLDDLRQKIKDIATENAKLILEADNTKMANADWKNKLNGEKNARKVLEKDLEDLKKVMEDTKLNQENTKKETEMVKDELDCLKKEHKDMVDDLCEKIRTSEVNVEIESHSSNLSEIINNIRFQYDKSAEKNLKETEDWYKSKFENIKVAEAHNTEALQSGTSELKKKLKQKQTLEMMIQTLHGMLKNLEDTLKMTKTEFSQRLVPINNSLLSLESELMRVRSQVEQQVEVNNALVGVKMKHEREINQYQELINRMTANEDSLEFCLADAVSSDQQKPENKVSK